MSKTVLQIPLDTNLREKAEQAAILTGFSSLQEVVRVFLNKFASQNIGVGFYEKEVHLSKKAEKRYAEMVNDVKRGKNVVKIETEDDLVSILK